MTEQQLDKLRIELSLKAKNRLNFTVAASLVWLGIACIWTLPATSYNKSIFTFIASSALLPLAFFLGKIFKAAWKIEGNPLEPLGLWLNFAQLFYFPFLIFTLLKYPDYFLMSYAIITGAHFFPYAWFYKETAYAVMAGVIALGVLIARLSLGAGENYFIGLLMSVFLLTLSAWLYLSHQQRQRSETRQAQI